MIYSCINCHLCVVFVVLDCGCFDMMCRKCWSHLLKLHYKSHSCVNSQAAMNQMSSLKSLLTSSNHSISLPFCSLIFSDFTVNVCRHDQYGFTSRNSFQSKMLLSYAAAYCWVMSAYRCRCQMLCTFIQLRFSTSCIYCTTCHVSMMLENFDGNNNSVNYYSAPCIIRMVHL